MEKCLDEEASQILNLQIHFEFFAFFVATELNQRQIDYIHHILCVDQFVVLYYFTASQQEKDEQEGEETSVQPPSIKHKDENQTRYICMIVFSQFYFIVMMYQNHAVTTVPFQNKGATCSRRDRKKPPNKDIIRDLKMMHTTLI